MSGTGRKIGLMGGTFNPIHNAHLALAERAADVFCLDEVWFIPSRNPQYKDTTGILSEEDRLQTVKLAVEGNERFRVSDIEMKREGATYTVDTLEELHLQYPDDEFFFIIGGDSLMNFRNWRNPSRISELAVIAATGRGGCSDEEIKDMITSLNNNFPGKFLYFSFPTMEISSTYIRETLKEGGSVRYLLPDKVIDYLKEIKYTT